MTHHPDTQAVIDYVNKSVGDALRFLGQDQFEIHNSGMKVVITLRDGQVIWFMYSHRVTALHLYGVIVHELMKRSPATAPGGDEG